MYNNVVLLDDNGVSVVNVYFVYGKPLVKISNFFYRTDVSKITMHGGCICILTYDGSVYYIPKILDLYENKENNVTHILSGVRDIALDTFCQLGYIDNDNNLYRLSLSEHGSTPVLLSGEVKKFFGNRSGYTTNYTL